MTSLLLSLLLLQGQQGTTNPSLFSGNSPYLYLYRDHKARFVGDIITIRIVENASATNSATTATQKEGDVSLSAPSLFGLERGDSGLNLSSILQGAGGISFNGTGSTSRTGQLQAAISARVVEVMPNGDLRLEGTKEVAINGERQLLTIRGLARVKDVSTANQVLSTSIADMTVLFNGKGVVADANRPGWLYKLFRYITPF
jgi:flagellar L-ring protein precursor FlgH